MNVLQAAEPDPEATVPQSAPTTGRRKAAEPTRPETPSRSDITRAKLVAATLEVIAEKGLSGVSHRVVASRAGVRLSATSYHFGSLDCLLEVAFDHWLERTLPWRNTLLTGSLELFAAHRAKVRTAESRLVMAREMAVRLGDFMISVISDLGYSINIECNFLFGLKMAPPLRSKVEHYRQSLLDMAAIGTRELGSQRPELDAMLVVGVLRNLQFECASLGKLPDREQLHETLYRLYAGIASLGGIEF